MERQHIHRQRIWLIAQIVMSELPHSRLLMLKTFIIGFCFCLTRHQLLVLLNISGSRKGFLVYIYKPVSSHTEIKSTLIPTKLSMPFICPNYFLCVSYSPSSFPFQVTSIEKTISHLKPWEPSLAALLPQSQEPCPSGMFVWRMAAPLSIFSSAPSLTPVLTRRVCRN